MNLCNYSDIFGKPNEGVHSFRILDIAVVDVVSTFFLAYLINYYYDTLQNVWRDFFILLFLSVLVHKLFCVETTLTNYVFR